MSFLERIYKAETAFAAKLNLDTAVLNHLQEVRKALALPSDMSATAMWIVAPVLTGFASWMQKQAGGRLFLGVMREGQLLCRLMQKLFDTPARVVWLNRNLSMLAAFGSGDNEALLNWLVRTRINPLCSMDALKALGRTGGDGTPLTLEAALALLEAGKREGWLEAARKPYAALGDRLLLHWRKTVDDEPMVALMDFAAVGNIQRSLETVLKAKDVDTDVLGLNFAMTAGAAWAEKAGCSMQGYLSQNGAPEWFAKAYARFPELMEIFAATPLGSLEGYAEDGAPLYGASFLAEAQASKILALQDRIVETAANYHRVLGHKLSANLARCVWGRFLLAPLPEEKAALEGWPLDAGLDGTHRRVVSSSKFEWTIIPRQVG